VLLTLKVSFLTKAVYDPKTFILPLLDDLATYQLVGEVMAHQGI